MAYIINRFNGTELTVVDDGVLDTTTSLGLVGRNYVGYGETQNENYVFLLENFSGNTPPARAISGQLWHDASNKTIRVYNGTSWVAVGNAQVQETSPTTSQGGLWLKTTTNQLYVSDGIVWRLVGPEAVEGFDVTKMTSTVLRSAGDSSERPVITVSIDGEIVAIYSGSDFTILGEDSILGFDTLVKGINYKTGALVSGNLKGNADTASKLLTSRRINTVQFDGSSDITIKSSTTNKLKKGSYIVGSDWDGTFEDTWGVDATAQNRIGKVVARDSNGDFAANIITADLFGNVTGNVTATTGTSTFNNISFDRATGQSFSGNSATATKLQNPPTINTVLFDGTEDVILPVPANTLTTDTLASNVLRSSLISLGKLESLEIEAPGLKVGDGNDLSIFIEGFTPTIRSDVTDVIKLQLFTGSTLRTESDISFIAARTAASDGGAVNPALVPDWNKSVLASHKIMLGTPSYRWRNVYSEDFTGDSLNILQVNSTGAEVQFNDPIKASAGVLGNLAGNVVGNLVGNVTGNVTGAASLNMLKSGDTMTGDLDFSATGYGLNWSFNSDGASIRFYNTGDADTGSRLEFETRDNGNEYFSWAHSLSGVGKFEAARLIPNVFGSSRFIVNGNVEASGTISGSQLAGSGINITNLNANNILTGRISNSLLTGSYDVDISGNARTVTSVTSGQVVSALGYTPANPAGGNLTGDWAWASTGRGLNWSFNTDGASIRFYNTGDGDTGSRLEFETRDNGNEYFSWAHSPSGGSKFEAARLIPNVFGSSKLIVNGNIEATGTISASTLFGSGSSISNLNASNLSNGTVPLARLAGTYNIGITGNAATVTSITSGQIVSALGYTPINIVNVLNQPGNSISGTTATFTGVVNVSTAGIKFPNDPYGGSGDTASITYEQVSGERTRLRFRVSNDASAAVRDEAEFIVPDVNAVLINGNIVLNAGNYTNYTVNKTGSGASGTWGINITGSASSASSASTATNLFGGSVSATTGSFSGVLNIAAGSDKGLRFPNDAFGGGSDTATITLETTGGEATKMTFRMTNDADDQFRFLAPSDNGITMNGYTMLHAGNYNAWAPTKTGGGASGTWPINITGNAASVSSITGAQVTAALGYTPANGSGPGNINGDQNYQDYLLRRPTIIDYSLYHNALGSRTGSVTINCESGNYVSCTATGAISFGFSNPSTGQRATGIILELTNGGNYTVTWPASVRWPAGTAPTLTVSGVDVLVFITDDGGSTWRGAVSMSDSR